MGETVGRPAVRTGWALCGVGGLAVEEEAGTPDPKGGLQ